MHDIIVRESHESIGRQETDPTVGGFDSFFFFFIFPLLLLILLFRLRERK